MTATACLAAGRYVLGDLLGRGGMAQVRQATDTLLDRQVAIKLFRDDLDEDAAARVEIEMLTLARLAHPGLVAVHDAGVEPDSAGVERPFLVMELVAGPTLAEELRGGALLPDRVRALGAELSAALAYVHGCGVVHRDVKPANILLSGSGAKLADFGIARIVDGARHTGTGLTIGTAPYLAPEQVTGEAVGPPADVYALGLVLLECLTGNREYEGTGIETALARLHRQPTVPAELVAPWPELLTAMTAREPQDRPPAAAVATALLGSEPAPTTVMPLPLVTERTRRRPRHGYLLAGAVGVVGLAVALVLGAWQAGPPDGQPTKTGTSVVGASPAPSVPASTAPSPSPRAVAPLAAPTRHHKGKGRHGG